MQVFTEDLPSSDSGTSSDADSTPPPRRQANGRERLEGKDGSNDATEQAATQLRHLADVIDLIEQSMRSLLLPSIMDLLLR